MRNENAAEHPKYYIATISLFAWDIYFTENDGISRGELTDQKIIHVTLYYIVLTITSPVVIHRIYIKMYRYIGV